MELIYLYIRKYGNLFKEQEFNFSSNHLVTFKEGNLLVEENKTAIKHYYGANINNVVMFLGQNGVGKSTLLDILGMRRDDRSDDTYTRGNRERKIKHSYFMLYHLYDEYYAFEFVDESFLKGEAKIQNIDMRGNKVDGALYKLPMGTIFRLEKGVFLYCGNIIPQWRERNGITKKLEYAYITSDKYNYRINGNHRKYYEDYMFERKYYLEEKSYEYLYKYFIYLKEMDNGLLEEKDIYIQNSIQIDFNRYDRDEKIANYLQDRKKEMDKLFNLKSRIESEMKEQLLGVKEADDTRGSKEIFLYTFYAQAIEYYFLEHLVGWSENKGLKIDINIPISFNELVLGTITKERHESNEGLQDIANFQEEYRRLLYQIGKNQNSDGTFNLKNVLEYVLNRVEVAASEYVNICDGEAVLNIAALLEKLPEDYFVSKKTIKVTCDLEKPNEEVVELLKWYDIYYKMRNEDNGSNNVFRILNVSLSKMSEGQRVFLDIISKCVSAIYTINPGDSLVLLIDEPDRALHPELARKFLDTLIDNITKCKDRTIQIVLSSHSPFIVTDILPENVYSIEQNDGIRVIQNNKETYATNIYYLLMDSFMLENTFGEYSYKQIKKVTEQLNDIEEITNDQLEKIKKVIDRIGEKTLKNKLLLLYKKRDDSKSKMIEQIMNITDEQKIEKIRMILEEND